MYPFQGEMCDYFRKRVASSFTVIRRINDRNFDVDLGSIHLNITFDGWCGYNKVHITVLEEHVPWILDGTLLLERTFPIEDWDAELNNLRNLDFIAIRRQLFIDAFSALNNPWPEIEKAAAVSLRRHHEWCDFVASLPDTLAKLTSSQRLTLHNNVALCSDAALRALTRKCWLQAWKAFPIDIRAAKLLAA